MHMYIWYSVSIRLFPFVTILFYFIYLKILFWEATHRLFRLTYVHVKIMVNTPGLRTLQNLRGPDFKEKEKAKEWN